MSGVNQQIIEAYSKGESVLKISRDLSIGYYTVYNYLKSNGFAIRKNDFTAKKYQCDSDYFAKIDNEEKAYWLGFIYADGYLSKTQYKSDVFGIALSKIDLPHLERFKKDIGFNGPILGYTSSKGYSLHTEYVRITIRDQKVCQDLEKCGVFYHKTNILQFPDDSIVPNDLVSHFIRGYFDGDGCFTYHINANGKLMSSIKICGTPKFLTELKKHIPLRNQNMQLYQRNPASIVRSLDFGGNKQTIRVMQYLYANASVYLLRKHEKFNAFLSEYNSRPHR